MYLMPKPGEQVLFEYFLANVSLVHYMDSYPEHEGRSYYRSLLAATTAPNLLLWVFKDIFCEKMLKMASVLGA